MGVGMATVEAMVTEFGCQVSNIVVVVGPSVGACCFTKEKEQALDFIRIHPDCVPDPDSDRPHVNIRLANRYGSECDTKGSLLSGFTSYLISRPVENWQHLGPDSNKGWVDWDEFLSLKIRSV